MVSKVPMRDFLSIGFRPFFCVGVLFAALASLVWGAFWQVAWQGSIISTLSPWGGMLFWHPHELIMGFVQAIIIGFLLTAARNWSGLDTTTPLTLTLLLTLWCWARYIMAFSTGYTFNTVLLSQLLTPLFAAALVARVIIKTRQWRNLFAPIMLLMMASLDGAILWQQENIQEYPAAFFNATILLTISLISIIGGRIIPLFSANKLQLPKVTESRTLFLVATLMPLLLTALLLQPATANTRLTITVCAAISAFAHGKRLLLWHRPAIWQHPMLWSLLVFYAALPIGFALLGLKYFFALGSIPIHFLAIGGIGGMIVSMVARVSLGHTGRQIHHDRLIIFAFITLIMSALTRTLGSELMGLSAQVILFSALLFALSFFSLFLRFIFAWLSPRADHH